MSAGALDLEGVEHFSSKPDDVFRVLTDIDLMPTLIPDLQSSEKVDPQQLKCVVRPGFSFIRGKLNITIKLEDLAPPESAMMQIAARGIGTEIDIESRFNLSPEGEGTAMAWSANVTRLKGLVSAVSPALTSAAAGVVLRSGWTEIRKALGETE